MTDDNSIVPENRNLLQLPVPVILVGIMGAGKTTVGRRLARDIGLDFIDSDHEITEAAGCSISDIFEIYGEPIFRDLEKRVLLRLLASPPAIIATGGGAFINPELRAAIQENAISIWLRADIEVLLDRVTRRNTRPLLEQGDKRAILTRLMTEREPIYAEAHLTVDSGKTVHEEVVDDIVELLRHHKKGDTSE